MPPVKLKLGIIGYPLEHTLSPIMHTAALQHLNINGEYKAYEIREEELEKKISEFKKQNFRGLNVTIPYKKKVIPFIDEMSENAKLTDAVNTITFLENGKLRGDNTDITGFWESIPEGVRKIIPEKNISILGCGGSACAAAVALVLNKTKRIKVYGRNKERLVNFKKSVESTSTTIIDIDLLNNIDLSKTFMLVNTTSIGMYPNIDTSPVTKDLLKKLPKDVIVYDIIYNPSETKLLKEAKFLGLNTLNGIEMLVRQGATSLNIWLDKNVAPIEVMKNAVV